jgi:hypothetical protein
MLRELDIPPDWVDEGKLGPLPNWLGPELTPEEARQLQGTILIAFPELEVDGVEIFDTQGVVGWLRVAHQRIPHLLYFLDPTPKAGAMEGLARTFLPVGGAGQSGPGIVLEDDQLTGLVMHVAATALYAVKVGDDWRPILSRLLEPVDQGHRDLLMNAVGEELGSS